MFGDSFYAEFQVETVYDSGFFPNKVQLTLVDDQGCSLVSTDKWDLWNKPNQNGIVINENYLLSVSKPEGNTVYNNKNVVGFGEYQNGIIVSPFSVYLEGNIMAENASGGSYLINNTNAKYAFAVGYDSTTKEFVAYYYSYNGSKYVYEACVKKTLTIDISSGYHFELTCFDTVNDPYRDAPCVNVKANFGSEAFLFPDIAEQYQYEMKEISITQNPDIDIYINDAGPKTGVVKVRKGSNVKIEAKSKDVSLQNYVRLYVTPEN